MAELVNIHQPHLGVLKEAPKARRPLASVTEAKNVMMREAGTGIRRLGSRPSLERLVAADVGLDGASISAVEPVTWAGPREIYTQLGSGEIETDWSRQAEDGRDVLDATEDGRGGVYSLTSGGRIERRNSEGAVAFAVSVPITGGMEVCNRLIVDPLGGIYAAASSGTGGGQSRLYKFLPRIDSDGADLAWIYDVDGAEIADITLRGGQVFAAINEPDRSAKIIAIENTGDGEPFQSWEMAVPYPVSCVDYGLGLVFSSLPSDDRGDGSPIGGDDSIWIESDLASADERVHAVYDARRSGDHPDGARMNRLVEIRNALGILSQDDTNRDLLQSEWFRPSSAALTVQNSGHGSPGPRFRSQLADGEPAIWFNSEEGSTLSRGSHSYDKGSGLWSREIDASLTWKSDKVTSDGAVAGSSGLWIHAPTQGFVVAWKLRWPVGAQTGMVWSVGGYLGHWQDPPTDTDSLCLTVQDDAASTVGFLDGGIALRGAVTGGVIGATGVLVDGMWEAIVLIERRVGANSILRVNGAVITSTLEIFQERFQSPREVWGNRIHNEEHRLAGTTLAPGYFWFSGVDSFDGGVQKAVSMFAPNGAGVHDGVFPLSDLEKIEGSMAWRRQTGDVLAGGHTYKSSAPPRGAGAPLPAETQTARALRSPDGIVGLLLPGQDAYAWAVAGSGIGYDHTADKLGNIYTTGPRRVGAGLHSDEGPKASVFRRMIDRGLSVDYLKPSAGEVVITAQPAVDDNFVIDPGDGPITFAFDGSGTPSATYVIVSRGGDAEGTAGSLLAALTGSQLYGVGVNHLGGTRYSIPVLSRQAPTGVAVAITKTGSNLSVLSGMDGGAAPAGAWDFRVVSDFDQLNVGVHMDSLPDGDLFAPWVKTGSSNSICRFSKDSGSVVWRGGTGTVEDAALFVSLDRRAINFGSNVDSPEYLWKGGGGSQRLERWRLVERIANNDAPQKEALLVVKGGQAFAVHDDGSVEALGAPGDFKEWDPYMQVLDYQGDLLISDGVSRKRWSPRNGTYEDWTAARGSEIPSGSHIMSAWNSRLVHAGGENPYNWIMSAAGDPDDYELFPSQASANQAVSGDSGDGQTMTQDQITGLIPAADDLLLILGSRSVSRMTGDPMAGGYLDSVTHGVGGAFGKAWAQAPDGSIYFFGVPHSVWHMGPGGQNLQNVSIGRVEEDLRTIDLLKYKVRLVDSPRMEGICVIPTPIFPDSNFDLRWWFMDLNGAWWPQSWTTRAQQPLTVTASLGTGEPILGCRDGVIRNLGGTTGLDDGEEMESSVMFGPYFDRQYHLANRYSRPFARIDGEAEIEWEARVGPDPLVQVAPDAAGKFTPGDETPGAMKVKGSSFWLRLRAFGSRWSFEGGNFVRNSAGRQK